MKVSLMKSTICSNSIIFMFHGPVTPCGIWPQQDLRVRFSYLEEEGGAIKEAEGLHLGLLSSRDGWFVGWGQSRLVR